ncbi:YCII-related protein [Hyaloraphidium curvatum]|nr:YCII-related protein [Hyaloraphidium curvatum]
MPLWAGVCRDVHDSGPKRASVRPAHIKRLQDDGKEGGPLLWSGPILDEKDPNAPRGSLFIVEAKDKAAAEAWVKADPFWGAGAWASFELFPVRDFAGTYISALKAKNKL